MVKDHSETFCSFPFFPFPWPFLSLPLPNLTKAYTSCDVDLDPPLFALSPEGGPERHQNAFDAAGRELLRRIKKRFDEEGIEISVPNIRLLQGEDAEPTPVKTTQ